MSRNQMLKAREARKRAVRRKKRPFVIRPAQIVTGHPEKMSVVLEEFIEPYRKLTYDRESLERLLMVGAVAWNVALFPPAQRQEESDKLIQRLGPLDEETLEAFKEIVTRLVERKDRFFGDNRRIIASFDLVDHGAGYYLHVMSSLDNAQ